MLAQDLEAECRPIPLVGLVKWKRDCASDVAEAVGCPGRASAWSKKRHKKRR